MGKKQKEKFNMENIYKISHIVLTIAVIFISYLVFNLNRNIANRNKSILEGKQYALIYDTRSFLIEYITNFFRYLAYEHHKVLTTEKLRTPRYNEGLETPTISRKYYVQHPFLSSWLECSSLINYILPEKQNDIEKYFSDNPTLKLLETDILDPAHTRLYLDLINSIECFNREFNQVAPRYKQGEKFWVEEYLKQKIDDNIIWSPVTVHGRNKLVDLIETVRYCSDEFLRSFPDLYDEDIKFIMEIELSKPFVEASSESPFDMMPNPVKEATIHLDKNTYKFDYFKYFVISTRKQLEDSEAKIKKGQESGEIAGPGITTNYRIVN